MKTMDVILVTCLLLCALASCRREGVTDPDLIGIAAVTPGGEGTVFEVRIADGGIATRIEHRFGAIASILDVIEWEGALIARARDADWQRPRLGLYVLDQATQSAQRILEEEPPHFRLTTRPVTLRQYLLIPTSRGVLRLEKDGEMKTLINENDILPDSRLCVVSDKYAVIIAADGALRAYDAEGNIVCSQRFEFMPPHPSAQDYWITGSLTNGRFVITSDLRDQGWQRIMKLHVDADSGELVFREVRRIRSTLNYASTLIWGNQSYLIRVWDTPPKTFIENVDTGSISVLPWSHYLLAPVPG